MMTVKKGCAAQSNNIQLKIPVRREAITGAATTSALVLFNTFTPVAIACALIKPHKSLINFRQVLQNSLLQQNIARFNARRQMLFAECLGEDFRCKGITQMPGLRRNTAGITRVRTVKRQVL